MAIIVSPENATVGCQDPTINREQHGNDEGRDGVSTSKMPGNTTAATPGIVGAAAGGWRGRGVDGEEIQRTPTSESLRGEKVAGGRVSPAGAGVGADSDVVLEALLGLTAAGTLSAPLCSNAAEGEAVTGEVVNDDSGSSSGLVGQQGASSSLSVDPLRSLVPVVESVGRGGGGGGGGGTAVARSNNTNNSGSGGSGGFVREAEGVGGRGSVGDGVEGADELEDWLDDMLAAS